MDAVWLTLFEEIPHTFVSDWIDSNSPGNYPTQPLVLNLYENRPNDGPLFDLSEFKITPSFTLNIDYRVYNSISNNPLPLHALPINHPNPRTISVTKPQFTSALLSLLRFESQKLILLRWIGVFGHIVDTFHKHSQNLLKSLKSAQKLPQRVITPSAIHQDEIIVSKIPYITPNISAGASVDQKANNTDDSGLKSGLPDQVTTLSVKKKTRTTEGNRDLGKMFQNTQNASPFADPSKTHPQGAWSKPMHIAPTKTPETETGQHPTDIPRSTFSAHSKQNHANTTQNQHTTPNAQTNQIQKKQSKGSGGIFASSTSTADINRAQNIPNHWLSANKAEHIFANTTNEGTTNPSATDNSTWGVSGDKSPTTTTSTKSAWGSSNQVQRQPTQNHQTPPTKPTLDLNDTNNAETVLVVRSKKKNQKIQPQSTQATHSSRNAGHPAAHVLQPHLPTTNPNASPLPSLPEADPTSTPPRKPDSSQQPPLLTPTALSPPPVASANPLPSRSPRPLTIPPPQRMQATLSHLLIHSILSDSLTPHQILPHLLFLSNIDLYALQLHHIFISSLNTILYFINLAQGQLQHQLQSARKTYLPSSQQLFNQYAKDLVQDAQFQQALATFSLLHSVYQRTLQLQHNIHTFGQSQKSEHLTNNATTTQPFQHIFPTISSANNFINNVIGATIMRFIQHSAAIPLSQLADSMQLVLISRSTAPRSSSTKPDPHEQLSTNQLDSHNETQQELPGSRMEAVSSGHLIPTPPPPTVPSPALLSPLPSSSLSNQPAAYTPNTALSSLNSTNSPITHTASPKAAPALSIKRRYLLQPSLRSLLHTYHVLSIILSNSLLFTAAQREQCKILPQHFFSLNHRPHHSLFPRLSPTSSPPTTSKTRSNLNPTAPISPHHALTQHPTSQKHNFGDPPHHSQKAAINPHSLTVLDHSDTFSQLSSSSINFTDGQSGRHYSTEVDEMGEEVILRDSPHATNGSIDEDDENVGHNSTTHHGPRLITNTKQDPQRMSTDQSRIRPPTYLDTLAYSMNSLDLPELNPILTIIFKQYHTIFMSFFTSFFKLLQHDSQSTLSNATRPIQALFDYGSIGRSEQNSKTQSHASFTENNTFNPLHETNSFATSANNSPINSISNIAPDFKTHGQIDVDSLSISSIAPSSSSLPTNTAAPFTNHSQDPSMLQKLHDGRLASHTHETSLSALIHTRSISKLVSSKLKEFRTMLKMVKNLTVFVPSLVSIIPNYVPILSAKMSVSALSGNDSSRNSKVELTTYSPSLISSMRWPSSKNVHSKSGGSGDKNNPLWALYQYSSFTSNMDPSSHQSQPSTPTKRRHQKVHHLNSLDQSDTSTTHTYQTRSELTTDLATETPTSSYLSPSRSGDNPRSQVNQDNVANLLHASADNHSESVADKLPNTDTTTKSAVNSSRLNEQYDDPPHPHLSDIAHPSTPRRKHNWNAPGTTYKSRFANKLTHPNSSRPFGTPHHIPHTVTHNHAGADNDSGKLRFDDDDGFAPQPDLDSNSFHLTDVTQGSEDGQTHLDYDSAMYQAEFTNLAIESKSRSQRSNLFPPDPDPTPNSTNQSLKIVDVGSKTPPMRPKSPNLGLFFSPQPNITLNQRRTSCRTSTPSRGDFIRNSSQFSQHFHDLSHTMFSSSNHNILSQTVPYFHGDINFNTILTQFDEISEDHKFHSQFTLQSILPFPIAALPPADLSDTHLNNLDKQMNLHFPCSTAVPIFHLPDIQPDTTLVSAHHAVASNIAMLTLGPYPLITTPNQIPLPQLLSLPQTALHLLKTPRIPFASAIPTILSHSSTQLLPSQFSQTLSPNFPLGIDFFESLQSQTDTESLVSAVVFSTVNPSLTSSNPLETPPPIPISDHVTTVPATPQLPQQAFNPPSNVSSQVSANREDIIDWLHMLLSAFHQLVQLDITLSDLDFRTPSATTSSSLHPQTTIDDLVQAFQKHANTFPAQTTLFPPSPQIHTLSALLSVRHNLTHNSNSTQPATERGQYYCSHCSTHLILSHSIFHHLHHLISSFFSTLISIPTRLPPSSYQIPTGFKKGPFYPQCSIQSLQLPDIILFHLQPIRLMEQNYHWFAQYLLELSLKVGQKFVDFHPSMHSANFNKTHTSRQIQSLFETLCPTGNISGAEQPGSGTSKGNDGVAIFGPTRPIRTSIDSGHNSQLASANALKSQDPSATLVNELGGTSSTLSALNCARCLPLTHHPRRDSNASSDLCYCSNYKSNLIGVQQFIVYMIVQSNNFHCIKAFLTSVQLKIKTLYIYDPTYSVRHREYGEDIGPNQSPEQTGRRSELNDKTFSNIVSHLNDVNHGSHMSDYSQPSGSNSNQPTERKDISSNSTPPKFLYPLHLSPLGTLAADRNEPSTDPKTILNQRSSKFHDFLSTLSTRLLKLRLLARYLGFIHFFINHKHIHHAHDSQQTNQQHPLTLLSINLSTQVTLQRQSTSPLQSFKQTFSPQPSAQSLFPDLIPLIFYAYSTSSLSTLIPWISEMIHFFPLDQDACCDPLFANLVLFLKIVVSSQPHHDSHISGLLSLDPTNTALSAIKLHDNNLDSTTLASHHKYTNPFHTSEVRPITIPFNTASPVKMTYRSPTKINIQSPPPSTPPAISPLRKLPEVNFQLPLQPPCAPAPPLGTRPLESNDHFSDQIHSHIDEESDEGEAPPLQPHQLVAPPLATTSTSVNFSHFTKDRSTLPTPSIKSHLSHHHLPHQHAGIRNNHSDGRNQLIGQPTLSAKVTTQRCDPNSTIKLPLTLPFSHLARQAIQMSGLILFSAVHNNASGSYRHVVHPEVSADIAHLPFSSVDSRRSSRSTEILIQNLKFVKSSQLSSFLQSPRSPVDPYRFPNALPTVCNHGFEILNEAVLQHTFHVNLHSSALFLQPLFTTLDNIGVVVDYHPINPLQSLHYLIENHSSFTLNLSLAQLHQHLFSTHGLSTSTSFSSQDHHRTQNSTEFLSLLPQQTQQNSSLFEFPTDFLPFPIISSQRILQPFLQRQLFLHNQHLFRQSLQDHFPASSPSPLSTQSDQPTHLAPSETAPHHHPLIYTAFSPQIHAISTILSNSSLATHSNSLLSSNVLKCEMLLLSTNHPTDYLAFVKQQLQSSTSSLNQLSNHPLSSSPLTNHQSQQHPLTPSFRPLRPNTPTGLPFAQSEANSTLSTTSSQAGRSTPTATTTATTTTTGQLAQNSLTSHQSMQSVTKRKITPSIIPGTHSVAQFNTPFSTSSLDRPSSRDVTVLSRKDTPNTTQLIANEQARFRFVLALLFHLHAFGLEAVLTHFGPLNSIMANLTAEWGLSDTHNTELQEVATNVQTNLSFNPTPPQPHSLSSILVRILVNTISTSPHLKGTLNFYNSDQKTHLLDSMLLNFTFSPLSVLLAGTPLSSHIPPQDLLAVHLWGLEKQLAQSQLITSQYLPVSTISTLPTPPQVVDVLTKGDMETIHESKLLGRVIGDSKFQPLSPSEINHLAILSLTHFSKLAHKTISLQSHFLAYQPDPITPHAFSLLMSLRGHLLTYCRSTSAGENTNQARSNANHILSFLSAVLRLINAPQLHQPMSPALFTVSVCYNVYHSYFPADANGVHDVVEPPKYHVVSPVNYLFEQGGGLSDHLLPPTTLTSPLPQQVTQSSSQTSALSKNSNLTPASNSNPFATALFGAVPDEFSLFPHNSAISTIPQTSSLHTSSQPRVPAISFTGQFPGKFDTNFDIFTQTTSQSRNISINIVANYYHNIVLHHLPLNQHVVRNSYLRTIPFSLQPSNMLNFHTLSPALQQSWLHTLFTSSPHISRTIHHAKESITQNVVEYVSSQNIIESIISSLSTPVAANLHLLYLTISNLVQATTSVTLPVPSHHSGRNLNQLHASILMIPQIPFHGTTAYTSTMITPLLTFCKLSLSSFLHTLTHQTIHTLLYLLQTHIYTTASQLINAQLKLHLVSQHTNIAFSSYLTEVSLIALLYHQTTTQLSKHYKEHVSLLFVQNHFFLQNPTTLQQHTKLISNLTLIKTVNQQYVGDWVKTLSTCITTPPSSTAVQSITTSCQPRTSSPTASPNFISSLLHDLQEAEVERTSHANFPTQSPQFPRQMSFPSVSHALSLSQHIPLNISRRIQLITVNSIYTSLALFAFFAAQSLGLHISVLDQITLRSALSFPKQRKPTQLISKYQKYIKSTTPPSPSSSSSPPHFCSNSQSERLQTSGHPLTQPSSEQSIRLATISPHKVDLRSQLFPHLSVSPYHHNTNSNSYHFHCQPRYSPYNDHSYLISAPTQIHSVFQLIQSQLSPLLSQYLPPSLQMQSSNLDQIIIVTSQLHLLDKIISFHQNKHKLDHPRVDVYIKMLGDLKMLLINHLIRPASSSANSVPTSVVNIHHPQSIALLLITNHIISVAIQQYKDILDLPQEKTESSQQQTPSLSTILSLLSTIIYSQNHALCVQHYLPYPASTPKHDHLDKSSLHSLNSDHEFVDHLDTIDTEINQDRPRTTQETALGFNNLAHSHAERQLSPHVHFMLLFKYILIYAKKFHIKLPQLTDLNHNHKTQCISPTLPSSLPTIAQFSTAKHQKSSITPSTDIFTAFFQHIPWYFSLSLYCEPKPFHPLLIPTHPSPPTGVTQFSISTSTSTQLPNTTPSSVAITPQPLLRLDQTLIHLIDVLELLSLSPRTNSQPQPSSIPTSSPRLLPSHSHITPILADLFFIASASPSNQLVKSLTQNPILTECDPDNTNNIPRVNPVAHTAQVRDNSKITNECIFDYYTSLSLLSFIRHHIVRVQSQPTDDVVATGVLPSSVSKGFLAANYPHFLHFDSLLSTLITQYHDLSPFLSTLHQHATAQTAPYAPISHHTLTALEYFFSTLTTILLLLTNIFNTRDNNLSIAGYELFGVLSPNQRHILAHHALPIAQQLRAIVSRFNISPEYQPFLHQFQLQFVQNCLQAELFNWNSTPH